MSLKMMSTLFFSLAVCCHLLFFVMESILFQKPNGHKLFKVPQQDHNGSKLWAMNQGFYNLFLALGLLTGLLTEQQILVTFCSLSMIGAGAVLFITSPRLLRGALLQMSPPILGFIFFLMDRHQI